VFGDHAGRVRALARADGAPRWTVETGAPVDAIPAVHDGLVIVGNRGYGLYALAVADGSEKWKTYFWGSWVESGAVVVDGIVYVGSSDLRRVSAISPDDGRPLWRTDVFGWTWGTPLVVGDVIYAGAAGGSPYEIVHRAGLSVISRRDGRLLARWPLPETNAYQWGIAGSPVLAGDVVLVTTIDGALLAFETGTFTVTPE
jgi:outer membrane protein assembly factor BamB